MNGLNPNLNLNFTLERYPTSDLLKLLANVLSHIAQRNDRNPPVAIVSTVADTSSSMTTAAKTVLSSPSRPTSPTSSTSYSTTNTPLPLTFHARNIPTISLESYLLRILKYCPTSNFVFLSLLVYFDRMAAISSCANGCNGTKSVTGAAARRIFRVDSYNVHRLVIAGVTVSSKFFSDVFYTNSRYAKVGGLPLPELNQLELQFLLLNDFRLVISPQQMHLCTQHLVRFSLEHPPPSMGLDMSTLAASLGIGFGLNSHSSSMPRLSQTSFNPLPKNKKKRTSPTTPKTTTAHPDSSSPSPSFEPPSPPLRPSSSPSPSPSSSSSSSLSSSPSASLEIKNGHVNVSNLHPQSQSRQLPLKHNKQREIAEDDSDSDEDDDSDEAEADEDREETETLTSTSTDDDSEPTIRGPRTVVGWDGESGRRSP